MRYVSRKKKMRMILNLALVLMSLVLIYSFFDSRIMPSLITISQIEAKKIAHKVIDDAVKESIVEMDLKAEDFIITSDGSNMFSANTILINQLCTEVSLNINESTPIFEERKVNVPMGSVTGWNSLANTGPKVGFSIRQIREADVDYETAFYAAGINQTNYKVWLNVTVSFQLVNPLISETVTSERKIMLIDTIIEGEVPQRFFSIE